MWFIHHLEPRAQFCCKMWGGQLGVKPVSSGRCISDVLYIHNPNLISRGILIATLITFGFILANDLHTNILKFVAGHGTVVQPISINIIFGCKQAQQYSRTHQLGFIRAVSCSAQNAESHCTHVHITITAEHFSFDAFYKCELQHDMVSCSGRLTLQNNQYFICTFPLFEKAANRFNATGHHACNPTPTKIPLLSSYQQQKQLAIWPKISVAYFTK